MNHLFWNIQLPHWKSSVVFFFCFFGLAETQKWRRCPVHQSWNQQSIARPNDALSKMEDGRLESNTFWKLNSRCSRCFRDTHRNRNCTSIHYMYDFWHIRTFFSFMLHVSSCAARLYPSHWPSSRPLATHGTWWLCRICLKGFSFFSSLGVN